MTRRSRRTGRRGVSPTLLARLPDYLSALRPLDGRTTVSSSQLAAASGVSPSVLRKDLAGLRIRGRRGVGYEVADLSERLREHVGGEEPRTILLADADRQAQVMGCPVLGAGSPNVVARVGVRPDEAGRAQAAREAAGLLSRHPGATVLLAVGEDETDDWLLRLRELGGLRVLTLFPPKRPVPAGLGLRVLDLGAELRRTAVLDVAPGPVADGAADRRLLESA